MNTGRRAFGLACLAVLLAAAPSPLSAQPAAGDVPLDVFWRAASESETEARAALAELAAGWRPAYAAMVLDLAELFRVPSQTPAAAPLFPGRSAPAEADASVFDSLDALAAPLTVSPVRERLLRFLERQTRNRFGHDFERWHKWVWSLPYEPHAELSLFKGILYGHLDPRMRAFFPPDAPSLIRLDEIEWGGVVVNGIPPLVYPAQLTAEQATYLADSHIVFGISVNGDARAYPKRILAWHELARDRVGEVELTIVYCTLCGTVLPYESVAGGRLRVLGTSGLLYRSNKLMFDEETGSLWSTLEGRPVVGALAGSGLELKVHSAVTTTWGEWRRLHPGTKVLSLDTGHKRDYSEGAAYRDYFGTDRLMFTVPGRDTRLKNKDEVLVMRVAPPSSTGEPVPLAIAAKFLERRAVYHTDINGRRLVVLTSRNGANRVYDAGAATFARVERDRQAVDDGGRSWTITEDALVAADGTRLPRVAAQRAFWFGWHAQFPATVLIK